MNNHYEDGRSTMTDPTMPTYDTIHDANYTDGNFPDAVDNDPRNSVDRAA